MENVILIKTEIVFSNGTFMKTTICTQRIVANRKWESLHAILDYLFRLMKQTQVKRTIGDAAIEFLNNYDAKTCREICCIIWIISTYAQCVCAPCIWDISKVCPTYEFHVLLVTVVPDAQCAYSPCAGEYLPIL